MLKRMIGIWLMAGLAGLAFNWLAPQGIGWQPDYISQPRWESVDLDQLKDLRTKGAVLVDAREPGVYKEARAQGALNLPPEEWDLLWPLLKPVLEKAPAVVLYGNRNSSFPAAQSAQWLVQEGLAQVYVWPGSLEDWEAAGLKVVRRQGSGS